MKTGIIAGIVLGALIAAWTCLMGITGWYKDPVLSNAFWMVVMIQIAVLIVTLWRTRRDREYFAQVGLGTLASLIAAVIAFANSLLFTSVLFPEYFEELRAMQVELARAEGLDEAAFQARLDAIAPMQTPFMQAFAGFAGTLLTGIVVSVIAGVFLRKKKQA